jgi:threonyl-tRNA synthetase
VVLVVGDSDVENATVGIRLRGEDEDERGVSVTEAAERIRSIIAEPR